MPSDDASYTDAGNAFGAGSTTSPSSLPSVPDARRSEPRGPRDERWLPLLLVLLTLVGTGLGLRRAEHRALADPVRRGERGDVVGVDGASLLAAEHLRRAFALIADRLKADEVVTDVDLRPVRVTVTVRDGVGRARSLAVDLAYAVHTQDDGRDTSEGPALARIDTAAPERFARTVLSRSRAPAAALTGLGWRYSAGAELPQGWTLQLADVPIPDQDWVADGSGRSVRRNRDPVPADPERPVTTTTTIRPSEVSPLVPGTRKSKSKRASGFETNAVQIVVGTTRIITDPASARRLRSCLERAGGSRTKQQRCVDALR